MSIEPSEPATAVRPGSLRGRTVEIPGSVLFRTVGDEAVLLELVSGRYYGLDAVGTRIWSLLVEHRRVAAVLDRLVAEYEVAADLLERDLEGFLATLSESGLVEVGDGP